MSQTLISGRVVKMCDTILLTIMHLVPLDLRSWRGISVAGSRAYTFKFTKQNQTL